MGLTDQTALHQADDAACTVHPAVLFSIVDHYSRREEDQNRVIGTLLGTIGDDGEVTVCSCPVARRTLVVLPPTPRAALGSAHRDTWSSAP